MHTTEAGGGLHACGDVASAAGGASAAGTSKSREYVALQTADTDYQSQFRRENIIA